MNKYTILAIDVDGTLQNSKRQITEHTRNTIIRAQEQGIKVVISSGRPTYGIAPLAEELELSRFGGYVLAFNGGEITEWASKRIMYEETLPAKYLPFIYSRVKENGFEILIYHDDHIVMEDASNEYARFSSSRNKMVILQVDSFLDAITYPVHKCLIVGNPERLEKFEAMMKNEIGGELNICRSEPFFMEVTPPHIDKAKCLSILLDKIGMNREQLIAFGDGFNDKSMIEYAGMGVAMGNAQQPVKEAADFVTLTNDEDGVAFAIEKFCL